MRFRNKKVLTNIRMFLTSKESEDVKEMVLMTAKERREDIWQLVKGNIFKWTVTGK